MNNLEQDLVKLMKYYSNFGAMDSEEHQAVNMVLMAGDRVRRFPLTGRNPFKLNESVYGWEDVSIELVKLAYDLWLNLIEKRLSIQIKRENDS